MARDRVTRAGKCASCNPCGPCKAGDLQALQRRGHTQRRIVSARRAWPWRARRRMQSVRACAGARACSWVTHTCTECRSRVLQEPCTDHSTLGRQIDSSGGTVRFRMTTEAPSTARIDSAPSSRRPCTVRTHVCMHRASVRRATCNVARWLRGSIFRRTRAARHHRPRQASLAPRCTVQVVRCMHVADLGATRHRPRRASSCSGTHSLALTVSPTERCTCLCRVCIPHG